MSTMAAIGPSFLRSDSDWAARRCIGGGMPILGMKFPGANSASISYFVSHPVFLLPILREM